MPAGDSNRNGTGNSGKLAESEFVHLFLERPKIPPFGNRLDRG
jgi:hypothetical protein